MSGSPPSQEIVFARLLGPSEEYGENGSEASSADSLTEGTHHPIMAELISRGVLEDDHMSAAQIEGLVRRHMVRQEVERAQRLQVQYQEEAASFHEDPTVPSDYNMMSFMQLIQRVDDLRALTWMRHCVITDHRQATNPFLESLGVQVQDMTPEAMLCTGVRMPMLVRPCASQDCARCQSGGSGYRFAWRGPWTCLSIAGTDPGHSRRVWQHCMSTRGCGACRRCQTPLLTNFNDDVV